jgi:S-adenosylmethionine:tRNA ribosyltransferase-isomerase
VKKKLKIEWIFERKILTYTPMKTDFLLSSYDYDLPSELIAQFPAQPAHNAKLLVLEPTDNGYQYHNQTFLDIEKMLTSNDVLLFNQTKVFKARIPLHEAPITRKS